MCAYAYGAVRGIPRSVGIALNGRGILAGVGPLIVIDGNRMSGGASAVRTCAAVVPRSRSGRLHAHASVRRMAAIVIGIGGFVVFGESFVMLLIGGSALVLVVLG